MYSLYNNVKDFIRENAVLINSKGGEISMGVYVDAAITVIFHVMVMAHCIVPSVLF